MKFNYKTKYIDVPKCYESCGSYCCKGMFNPYFKFLNHDFELLPLLECELKNIINGGGGYEI